MPARRSGVAPSSLFSNRFNEVVGLILIASAVFLALALWSFHIDDPSWAHRGSAGARIHNFGGTVGAYLAGGLVQLVGAFAALVPIGVFAWGVSTFSGMRPWWPGWHGLGGLTIALCSAGLFHKAFLEDPLFGTGTLAGGVAGYGVAAILETALGRVGSWVVLLGALTAALVATTGMPLAQMIVLLIQGPRWIAGKAAPLVWKAASAIAGWVYGFAQGWLMDRARSGISGIRGFGRNLRGEWRRFSDRSAEGAGFSDGDSLEEPSFVISGEGVDREPAPGGFGVLSAVGRGLEHAKKLRLGLGERAPREEWEDDSHRRGSSSALAVEEASLSLFPGEGLDSGDKGREYGFRLGSGDKGRAPGPAPHRVVAKKSRDSGIRIGRRKVPAMGDAAPATAAVRPARKEAAPSPAFDATGFELIEEEAGEADTPENRLAEMDVRVRHAGLDGEAEIVRIEDDAVVSDRGVPDLVKSGLKRRGRYELPTMDLFADSKDESIVVDEKGIRKNTILLERTLLEFGVEGRVTEVKTGPVITIYEFVPAAGVKVSKITALADDLARALSAMNVRIVAPIPGTSAVGIEVPNAKRKGVRIKEILSSREFARANDKLTLGIGKDILGRTALTDLAKIPHLLIAGSTGAGKSVTLNMMICSLLVRCMPREVRLVMIDPKMLEFSIYEGVPHLLVPVITSPKKASAALRGVVAEMESRYSRMSQLGVRNIDSYNQMLATRLGPRETNRRLRRHLDEAGDEQGVDFMPYIVVVIDELADLMMVSSRDVEENMTRLAQMARAAGIHLLVATQRPSVDVLTGIIKANFPSRLSLRVASRTDSRTILDMNGAERLLGKGDMLFIPPGTSTPTRIHGAYVAEKEIRNLVNYWKNQGPTAFQNEIFVEAESQSGEGSSGEDEYDERYDDAVALVARTGEASISLIQRHLRIGYNRAARLIEKMEQEGIVGPSDGVKRRQVLVRNIPESDIEEAETQ